MMSVASEAGAGKALTELKTKRPHKANEKAEKN